MADLPTTRKRLPVREHSVFQSTDDGRWTASFAPLNVSAEGVSEEEAWEALRDLANKKLGSDEGAQKAMKAWAEEHAIEEAIPEEELRERDELMTRSKEASTRIRAVGDADFESTIAASKPVLVDFWAEWCVPCHMMNPVLAEVAEAMADQIDVVKFEIDAADIDESRNYWQKYEIRGIPCLILFKEGQELHRIVGAGRDRDQLIKELESGL